MSNRYVGSYLEIRSVCSITVKHTRNWVRKLGVCSIQGLYCNSLWAHEGQISISNSTPNSLTTNPTSSPQPDLRLWSCSLLHYWWCQKYIQTIHEPSYALKGDTCKLVYMNPHYLTTHWVLSSRNLYFHYCWELRTWAKDPFINLLSPQPWPHPVNAPLTCLNPSTSLSPPFLSANFKTDCTNW